MGMHAHVTLLAPFTPPDQLVAGRMREVRDVLAAFQPFDFKLAATSYLDLGSRRVLYLRPEPGEPFLDLIDALVERFPEHPPYGRRRLRPVPHLTVATSPDQRLLNQIERAVQPELPIAASANDALVVEYGERGCRIRSHITLGDLREDALGEIGGRLLSSRRWFPRHSYGTTASGSSPRALAGS